MISDYPSLIARVTERSGHPDVARRAAEYVTAAEEYIRTALQIDVVDLISPLTSITTAGTNWLLEEDAEAYVLAVLFQVHKAKMQVEQATLVKALLDEALDKIHYDAKLESMKGVEIEWEAPAV